MFNSDQKIVLSRFFLDSKKFKLEEEIRFKNIHILKGFYTDGASVSIGRYLIGCPFEEKYLAPAIIHDGLYASELYPRKKADKIFKEALLFVGVSSWKANAMYLAVRAFGGFPWGKHTVASVRKARQFVKFSFELEPRLF